MINNSFPSKQSRIDLPSLLRGSGAPSRTDAPSTSSAEQITYFAVCFFYALGPSLLDIFLARFCKQT
jgi:hypothetical protein